MRCHQHLQYSLAFEPTVELSDETGRKSDPGFITSDFKYTTNVATDVDQINRESFEVS